MNWAHIHLAVNHVPVILVPVAVALLAFAVVRKSADVSTVSLGLFVIAAVFGGGVFLTGEPAEEVVEDLPGISESAIEVHEEAAEIAAITTGFAGLLAVVALVLGRGRQAPTWLLGATLVVGLGAAGMMARAANLGGQIHHPEITTTSETTTSSGENGLNHRED